ncbi:hypothetical protein [Mycolicibacterium houstonense]|uniref:hypothetical protein n=1 Tax=Mycolicibacterium houstonense TaxID=146021 RepID=UPI003F999748
MTHQLPITVYLNNGDAQFHGFGRLGPAQLAVAAQFNLPVTGAPSTDQVKTALETVFEQLNIDDPDQTWALRYRLDRHRSLSVGDVVAVGETAWAVAPIGWDLVSTDQLRAALTQ